MSSSLSKQSLSDEDAVKQRRELLLKVYGSILDEYRFNVNLGWDQTKFYVTTASAVLAAGIGLLKLALDSMLLSTFMIIYFLLPVYIALLGIKTAEVRKKYVREANLKKTLVELELELVADIIPGIPGTGLGIAVTPGQKHAITALVDRKERLNAPVKRNSIVYLTKLLFIGIAAISVAGSFLSFLNLSLLFDATVLAPKR